MERIKDNAGTIAIGLAATAIAGLLLWKSYKSTKTEEETPAAEEEDIVPDRFFFMDPTLSIDKMNDQITDWAKEQVEALLSQTED